MEKIRDASDATHISCDFRTEKDYRDDRALCPPVTRLQAQWWHGWNIFGRSLLVGLRRCLFQRIVEDSSSNTPTPQRQPSRSTSSSLVPTRFIDDRQKATQRIDLALHVKKKGSGWRPAPMGQERTSLNPKALHRQQRPVPVSGLPCWLPRRRRTPEAYSSQTPSRSMRS